MGDRPGKPTRRRAAVRAGVVACVVAWSATGAAVRAQDVTGEAPVAGPSAAPSEGSSEMPSPAVRSGAADELGTVVVHGRRPQLPAGQRSVSGEDMRRVPGSLGDPLKSLQSLPGVVSVGDTRSQPAIRGSRPQDNRYYVDGLPSGNLFHVGGLTSTLHPDLVQRFDLYSAGFGPEYVDATGGVIDVRLRRPATDRVRGALDVSLLGADVLLEGPVAEGQSFVLAGKRSWLDLVVKRASNGTEAGSDGTVVEMPRYHDHLAKYFWRLNADHELQLHVGGSSDRIDLRVPADSLLARQQPVLAGDGNLRSRDQVTALTWDAQLADGVHHRLSLGRYSARSNSVLGTALDLDVRQRSRFLIEQLRFQPARDHQVTLGGEGYDVSTTYAVGARNALCSEFSPDCDHSSAVWESSAGRIGSRVWALYLKDRWQFAPRWALTAGLQRWRDGYLQRGGTDPRLALEWQWSPDTLWSAAWGRYNQIPEPHQIAPDLGNPRLDHLHATHAVLGVNTRLDPAWSWQTEVYRKSLRDLVVGEASSKYVNAGSGTAHGVEVLLRRHERAGSRWSGWLSVSWARSQRRNGLTGETFRFAHDQPLVMHLVGRYRLGGGWELGAKWTYHTGLPDTAILGGAQDGTGRYRPVYGALNGERLPAYHRLDLRVEKRLRRDVHFYAEVLNAYNRQNLSGYTYSADYSSRAPVRQLGWVPSVGVKVDF